jgi:pimeloyl-ACP methyl ester carboxylesterase
MDALSEEYRVYAFDLWGFGDSDKSLARYDLESYVDLLGSFIRELGMVGPLPLVGHALGASVAVSYARDHTQEVDRVMAISLPLGIESVNQRLLTGAKSPINRILGRGSGIDHEDVRSEMGRTAPEAIKTSVRSVLRMDLRATLRQVEVPLLVVYGDQDNIVSPTDIAQYAGINERIHTITFPGCRHFPMLDRGSQFNRLLLEFLAAPDDLSDLRLKNKWVRRIR